MCIIFSFHIKTTFKKQYLNGTTPAMCPHGTGIWTSDWIGSFKSESLLIRRRKIFRTVILLFVDIEDKILKVVIIVC